MLIISTTILSITAMLNTPVTGNISQCMLGCVRPRSDYFTALAKNKDIFGKVLGSIWIPRTFDKLNEWKRQSYQSKA
jgi:hypothetical protein